MSRYESGALIAFSEGEYSDYGYVGVVRTLREVDIPRLSAQFKNGYGPKDAWDLGPDPQSFVGWLTANGYIEAVDYNEVHLGSYGRLDA